MNDKEILLRSSYDFEFFCTKVLGLIISDHHRKIAELLKDESKNKVVIEVARGHGKTELMKAYVIWYATFNEKKKICIISSAKEQSWDIQKLLRTIRKRNGLLHILFFQQAVRLNRFLLTLLQEDSTLIYLFVMIYCVMLIQEQCLRKNKKSFSLM